MEKKHGPETKGKEKRLKRTVLVESREYMRKNSQRAPGYSKLCPLPVTNEWACLGDLTTLFTEEKGSQRVGRVLEETKMWGAG